MPMCDQVRLKKKATILKALSNPNRLRIIMELAAQETPGGRNKKNGPLGKASGEIGLGLGIAPSTVSYHLKALRKAGIIHRERLGRQVVCWIDPDLLMEFSSFLPPPKKR